MVKTAGPCQYWVVGASWGGVDHQDGKFVEQGIWMLGWEGGKQLGDARYVQPTSVVISHQYGSTWT